MKITDLQASYIEVPFVKPFRDALTPNNPAKGDGYVLVKVFTDEGIVGIGTQKTPFPEWIHYVNGLVREFVLNEVVDPFYIEKFSAFFRAQAFGTRVSPRPCCVEIALWDIIGKASGQPVFKLLGARQNRVKAYASTWEPYPLWGVEEWIEFCQFLAEEEGFRAIKLHIGWQWPDPEKIIEVVAGIRQTLGDGVELMVDAMQAWRPKPLYDFRAALKYAQGMEEYDVAFLEEPLPHFNNPDLSARLCNAVDIEIAGGGAMFGLHTYKYVLEKGALDIVQPDVQFAGGILEVKKITTLAESYGKTCIPHCFGNGIGLAATLQVTGACDIPYVEIPYHPPYWTNEFRDTLLTNTFSIDKDGYIDIPDKPGLGIELDQEAVKQYTVL